DRPFEGTPASKGPAPADGLIEAKQGFPWVSAPGNMDSMTAPEDAVTEYRSSSSSARSFLSLLLVAGLRLAALGTSLVELCPFQRADVLLDLHLVPLVDRHDFPVRVGEHRRFAGHEQAGLDDLLVLRRQVRHDLEVRVVGARHARAAAPAFLDRVDL